MSLEHNSRLNTLKDVVCCTLTGREFHSVVVDKIKDFRRSSVLQLGISLSNGLRLWYGFLADTKGGTRSVMHCGQKPSCKH